MIAKIKSKILNLVAVRDKDGFTTLGVVVSLLLTLTLLFSSAQVYRVMSASADIQNVSDACSLTAQNQVCEFMILVRVCDSVILSLSLSSIVAAGLGTVAMCTPVTAVMSDMLLEAAVKIIEARDKFADASSKFLNKTQKALPFISSVKAYELARSNSFGAFNPNYIAISILMPGKAQDIEPGNINDIKNAVNNIKENAPQIKEAAKKAEEAAKTASQHKLLAFMADCGNNPNYCMYERAKNKAYMNGSNNPLFQSPDTWNFEIPFKRSIEYYKKRLEIESPINQSVQEQANSSLRKVFYRFAEKQLEVSYVLDTGDNFSGQFPHFPHNTEEMKTTNMYTDANFAVSSNHKMHAYEQCPGCSDVSFYASLEQFDNESYEPCEYCSFSPSELGKVAQASSAIDNGFEYHYSIVENSSKEYKSAKDVASPLNNEVKNFANGIFDKLKSLISQIANKRIYAMPPGSYGNICLTVNTNAAPANSGFESNFVKSSHTLGIRAAVSASTMIEENSEQGKNIITSVCDGFKDQLPSLSGVVGIVLGGWSKLLTVYCNGQNGLIDSLEQSLNQLPLFSASGLGTWAAKSLRELMQDLGLEPPNILALKPVLINSAYIANAQKNFSKSAAHQDFTSGFSVNYLVVKDKALHFSDSSNQLLGAISNPYDLAKLLNLDELIYDGGTVEVAVIQPIGDWGPSIPITIKLPESSTLALQNIVSWIADLLQSVTNNMWERKVWR